MNELIIRLTGAVSESNLEAFKEKALAEIKAANKDLVTEEDFAEAETVIKKCSATEKMIVKTKEDALNQTADIRKLFSSLDELSEELRTTRLALEKKVVSEKEKRKAIIINAGIESVRNHIADATKGPRFDDLDGLLAVERETIQNAIKGKKTLKGMEEAVAVVVQWNTDKIDLNKSLFVSNFVTMEKQEEAYPGLFPDKKNLCVKPAPELAAIIDGRIAKFKLQAEEKRQRDEKEEDAKKEQDAKVKTDAIVQEKVVEQEYPQSQTTVAPTNTVSPPPSSVDAEGKTTYIIAITLRCSKEEAIEVAQGINDKVGDCNAVVSITLTESEGSCDSC